MFVSAAAASVPQPGVMTSVHDEPSTKNQDMLQITSLHITLLHPLHLPHNSTCVPGPAHCPCKWCDHPHHNTQLSHLYHKRRQDTINSVALQHSATARHLPCTDVCPTIYDHKQAPIVSRTGLMYSGQCSLKKSHGVVRVEVWLHANKAVPVNAWRLMHAL